MVRAYSSPLGKPVRCEKVTVTNCNITSHSSGIRIGWYNDGEIRNCTFSNLTITDSTVGIGIYLPNTPEGGRGSDEGEEDTLIENLSFSEIMIDRCYYEPVLVRICERNRCAGIRSLYFTGLHSFSVRMPAILGREGCPVENVYFTNCHFTQIERGSIEGEEDGPHVAGSDYSIAPCFRHVRNLVMQDTAFTVL